MHVLPVHDIVVYMAKKKRSPDQVTSDRALVATWLLQGYEQQEIADRLFEATGLRLSREQIKYDISKIRRDWMQKQESSYDALVNQELARLDALEAELWRAMRESAASKERRTIEEIARKVKDAAELDDTQYNLFVDRVSTTIEKGQVNPAFFTQIMEVQKERRRLLGLYPATRMGLDIHKREEIIIKGYGRAPQTGLIVSPDDWPDADVVEGEFNEVKALPANVDVSD